MLIKRYFTVREAARAARVTEGVVDYLARSGVVPPSGRRNPGRGRPRLYTFSDLVLLRALAQLLIAGIPVARLKTALRRLRRRDLAGGAPPAQYLVTDGTRIFLKNPNDLLEDLSSGGQLAFAFLIELHQVRRDVLEALPAGSAGETEVARPRAKER